MFFFRFLIYITIVYLYYHTSFRRMKKGTRNLAAALKPKDQDPKGKKIDLALLGAFRPMDPVEDSTNSGATLISSQSSSLLKPPSSSSSSFESPLIADPAFSDSCSSVATYQQINQDRKEYNFQYLTELNNQNFNVARLSNQMVLGAKKVMDDLFLADENLEHYFFELILLAYGKGITGQKELNNLLKHIWKVR